MNRLNLEAGQYLAPDQVLSLSKRCPVPLFGFYFVQRFAWLDASGLPYLVCEFSLN